MKTNKKFDCVEMKNEIQKKMLKEKSKFSSESKYQAEKKKELMKDIRFAEALKRAKKLDNEENAAWVCLLSH